MSKRILTAESVTEGHPDKLCDLIADSILDACLEKDKAARVACEVMATAGKITVAGEITAMELPDIAAIVCKTVRGVGYSSNYEVEILTHDQSTDISDAVDGRHTSQNCSPSRTVGALMLPYMQTFSGGGEGYSAGDGEYIPQSCSGKGSVGPLMVPYSHGPARDGGYLTRNCLGNATVDTLPAIYPHSLGAGDQGIVYGYATGETAQLLPLPVVLANRLTMGLTFARKLGIIKGILPDGKAQVSVEYDGKKPVRIAAVVVSCQHEESKDTSLLRREIQKLVIEPALAGCPMDGGTEVFINPSGRFVLGGFEADTGLTGRKLMADTYGGLAPHGGGALSGKDGTKVDRSGAYMARYAAKNIVAAHLARECTVCAAYAIGRAKPIAVTVDTHGTGLFDDAYLAAAVRGLFDFSPIGMIRALGLASPIFAENCCYGHFMHTAAPWERTDKAAELGAIRAILKEIEKDGRTQNERVVH